MKDRRSAAPSKAELVPVRGARLLRTRAHVAPASVAIEAQRRFLAFAAHELRGELALQRALVEVTLADRSADGAALREMGEHVVVACERQERLLEGMLTLARSGCGGLRREPVDLAAIAGEVLRAHPHHGLATTTELAPARTTGDRQLVERLVANLVANAIAHNVAGGRLEIRTHTAAVHATFRVANTGPVIATGELTRLFQPFQRLGPHAGAAAGGVGLGLAIVQTIATAHDAIVTARARTRGGLAIDVAFPALD